MGVERELSFTYGSIQIGGASTDYLLDNWTSHLVTDGTAESSASCECVVTADSEDQFAALCRAIENAFRTPRKKLVVSQGGVKLIEADHASARGGFNTNPQIEKAGDVGDSGRSRRYRVTVQFETPADNATIKGLRDRVVNVSYDEARIRTIRISGTFTGTPADSSARSRYEAAISALKTSVLSGLGVSVSELIGEPVTEEDYDDKVLRFERVFLELKFGQGQDTPNDDAGIVDQTLVVTRREFSEERSEGALGPGSNASSSAEIKQLAVFDLHYEASIDVNVTTDLDAKYNGIREWLIGQFSAVFNQSDFALTVERPSYDRPRNRIIADLTAEGAVEGADFITRTFSVQDKVTEGHVFRSAWDGDALSVYRYLGFAIALRVVTETYRRIGNVSPQAAASAADALAKSFTAAPIGDTVSGGGAWFVIDRDAASSPVTLGLHRSGNTLEFSDVTTVVTLRYVKEVQDSPVTPGGATTGGGGTTTDFGTTTPTLNSAFLARYGPGGIAGFLARSGP